MHRYQWSASVEARLQQATERMRQLRQATLPTAAVQSVRHWFRVHHTYHSNAIEGNRLTLPETRAVLEDGITIQGKSLKDHLEAVNLAQALDFVESLSKAETPLGERDLREIHMIVLRGIEPENAGVYRRINVRISGTEHVPPEALHVPDRMREFGEWLASTKPEHPIVVSAIAHAWFETIHPFVDGNGRTGRLLANLLLMRQAYPAMVLRVQERARYYAALDTSHSGDLTPMLELTLDCVEQSLAEYERAAREAFEVQEPAIQYLAERLGAAKADPVATPEFLQWKWAVEELYLALKQMAERISAQLSQHQNKVSLTVTLSHPIDYALWRAVNSQTIGESILHVDVENQNGRAGALIRAYPGMELWWDSMRPFLEFELGHERQAPHLGLVAAVPSEHLFTALYADDDGRSELLVQRMTARHEKPTAPGSMLPPGVTRKEKVSAQQLAVDIWKNLVENHLA